MAKTVAILTGGNSSERAVAFWSAENVVAALRDHYDVRVYDVPSELLTFLAERDTIDVAVPVLHGVGGEDGTLQGFLKTLGIPFVFSDVAAHAIGLNKAIAKAVVASRGLHVAPSVLLKPGERYEYAHPVVVKPVAGGSTIGVAIARSAEECKAACAAGFAHGQELLVEQFVEGDEFTVPVIDEHGTHAALPVIQIKSDGLFDFERKYVDGKMAEELCPAPIDDILRSRLQEAALTAHRAIGARHLSRTDFIVDAAGTIWFLEINTIPGMTKNSLVPKSVRVSGREFGALLRSWVEEVS